MTEQYDKSWASGDEYEYFMGRWSRLIAREFLPTLDVSLGGRWLDIGCGTGALSRTILAMMSPQLVQGIDASADYVAFARTQANDHRLQFDVADVNQLPYDEATYDAVVSGLVLNFLPDKVQALSEMKRVTKTGGVVAVYVWDYAGGMAWLRYFWDAVIVLDPSMRANDEGNMFPICQPDSLRELFNTVGFMDVEVYPIDVRTHFANFDDYWKPFLGGQGPGGAYVRALDDAKRATLQEQLRATLPVAEDGSIDLTAQAWAVRGKCQ
ncbi:MAG: class I SAM-dependent methyltransferase [Chloroflexi bacterium]|nr:MAG: class I SAM-dependent methyltransferase [Chloroflexota bacterium]